MMNVWTVLGLVFGAFIVGIVVCSFYSEAGTEARKLHKATIWARSALALLDDKDYSGVGYLLDSIAALEGEDN